MLSKLVNIIQDEDGQGMVEYGLILVLIAVMLITGLAALRGGLSTLFVKISNDLEQF